LVGWGLCRGGQSARWSGWHFERRFGGSLLRLLGELLGLIDALNSSDGMDIISPLKLYDCGG
jgi:hypothetical protein